MFGWGMEGLLGFWMEDEREREREMVVDVVVVSCMMRKGMEM